MVVEDEKINRRRLSTLFLICSSLIVLGSCSVLDPLSLTLDENRQKIVDEILKRGRLYTIRKQDEAQLLSLLKEKDPNIRLAAVKLMGHNPSQPVYDALITAYMDENEAVSSEAQRILLSSWKDSYKAVIRGLNSNRSGIVYASIDLIRLKQSKEVSLYLLTLFSDERPTVRARASRVFVSLNEYEQPWFQSLLESPNPLVRQTAVETLPRFKNPKIVPSLLKFILDPVSEVRTAAIFGISEFDKAALPALHETVKIGGSRELRLSVLQLIDGIMEPESIPVLVSLLSDEDSVIASKSAEILFREGAASIPELLKQMPEMKPAALLLSLDLIRRYGDLKGLASLSSYFVDKNQKVRDRAVETVRAFGKKAHPYLIEVLDNPNQDIRNKALQILVEQRAPSLVYDETKNDYPVDRVFYFFETETIQEVQGYLSQVSLPDRVVNALKNLFEIELNTRQYQEIREVRDKETYPYLYYFRQWENDMISAELSRQSSFAYMHYYFDTGHKEWLSESKQMRDTAELFETSAGSALKSALQAGRKANKGEISLVTRYLYSRKQLSESWRSLGADIQSLAMLVFLRYSLDIQIVVRDYDYFRILQGNNTPVPKNLN